MERRRRDLSVTIYRILLYLSRMRERDAESKRLMRIERATGIERKELKIHLEKLVDAGYVKQIISCLLYTSPSPRDLSTSRMPSSA